MLGIFKFLESHTAENDVEAIEMHCQVGTTFNVLLEVMHANFTGEHEECSDC